MPGSGARASVPGPSNASRCATTAPREAREITRAVGEVRTFSLAFGEVPIRLLPGRNAAASGNIARDSVVEHCAAQYGSNDPIEDTFSVRARSAPW